MCLMTLDRMRRALNRETRLATPAKSLHTTTWTPASRPMWSLISFAQWPPTLTQVLGFLCADVCRDKSALALTSCIIMRKAAAARSSNSPRQATADSVPSTTTRTSLRMSEVPCYGDNSPLAQLLLLFSTLISGILAAKKGYKREQAEGLETHRELNVHPPFANVFVENCCRFLMVLVVTVAVVFIFMWLLERNQRPR